MQILSKTAGCLDGPALDDPLVHDDIETAYSQVVQGVRRLIELAVGWQVEVSSGIYPGHFDGFHATVSVFQGGGRPMTHTTFGLTDSIRFLGATTYS
jgi:hypothetical protein